MPAAKKTSAHHAEEKPKKRVVRRKAHATDGVSKADHDVDGLSLSPLDKQAISERVDAITRKSQPGVVSAPEQEEDKEVASPEAGSDASSPTHARDIHQSTYSAAAVPVTPAAPIKQPVSKATASSSTSGSAASMAMPVVPKYEAAPPQPVMESAVARPAPAPKDAGFLAPAHDNFNLKSKDEVDGEGSSWLKKAVYLLGILIALAAIALVALTFYAPQILNKITNKSTDTTQQDSSSGTDTGTDQTGQQGGATSPTVSSSHTVNVVNANPDIQRYLQSAVSKYSDIKLSFDTAGVTTGQSGVSTDTLFFNTSAKADASKIQSELAAVGLTLKIEEDAALKTDYVVALVKTIKPDLSNLTAAVYNATGKSGLAKSYCTALTTYKVTSCNALNSTEAAKGLVVYSNQSTLLLKLKRTPEFANASFVPAANGQVEDIRVVAGK